MSSTTDTAADDSLFATPEASQDHRPEIGAADDPQPSESPAGEREGDTAPGVDAAAQLPATVPAGEVKPILEALIFVAHEPVTIERLTTVLGSVPKADVRQALESLKADYDRDGRGLQLVEVAGGFQLTTRPECAPWIKAMGKSKAAPKLTRSGLESLAIIAYKQPIVRSEIEAIRGVETSGVIRTLLERKLVRIVGRKDVPGRPIMYGTTKHFLQHFGLRDLSELPPLREFKELGESEQAMLPVGDEPLQVSAHEALPGAAASEASDRDAGEDFPADEETSVSTGNVELS